MGCVKRLVLLAFCATVLVVSNAQGKEVIDLQDAIEMALKNSPVLQASRSDLKASTHGVKAEKGQLLPQITGYADYSRKSDPVVVVPIKEFGGRPPNFSRDQYAAGVRVLIPVYEGGRLRARITAAKLQEEIAQRQLSFTRQDLIANVTNVFYQILYLKELITANDKTLNALKKAREDASVKLKIGRIAPVDLMRMDTQVASQEQALINAKEEKQRALNTLCLLIGWQESALPQIKGQLKKEPAETAGINNVHTLVDMALKQRPDILASEAAVKKAKADLRYAKGGHLPSLDLVGDYSRHAGSGLKYDEEVWTGGVAVTMNIFSGGTISAKVQQAASKLQAAERRLQNQRLKVRKEVLDAISRIREARHLHRVARTTVDTAKETYRIEKLKYESGAGSITDMLLAQAQWQNALANEVSARFLIQKAGVELRLALGLMDVKEDNQIE